MRDREVGPLHTRARRRWHPPRRLEFRSLPRENESRSSSQVKIREMNSRVRHRDRVPVNRWSCVRVVSCVLFEVRRPRCLSPPRTSRTHRSVRYWGDEELNTRQCRPLIDSFDTVAPFCVIYMAMYMRTPMYCNRQRGYLVGVTLSETRMRRPACRSTQRPFHIFHAEPPLISASRFRTQGPRPHSLLSVQARKCRKTEFEGQPCRPRGWFNPHANLLPPLAVRLAADHNAWRQRHLQE